MPKPRIKLGLAAEWQVPICLANACGNVSVMPVGGLQAQHACSIAAGSLQEGI